MSFSAGTEGAAFLDIPVGAGPAALGGAYTALATDAYSPVYNPGGLGFLDSTQIAGQHLSYLESVNYEYASFVHPFTAGHALGISAQYLTSGDIPGTDPTGNPTGDYSSHYGAYTLAYGQKLGDHLSLGLATKWINAKISDVSADAFAAELGALYHANDKLQLAATVDNLGSTLKFVSQNDNLPMSFHLGSAFRIIPSVLISAEGIYSRETMASFRTGAEWHPLDLISIRAGYRTDTIKENSPMAGVSAGVGLHFWGQELAYAWLPYDELGTTHYISLLLRFGDKDPQAKRNLIQYQHIRQHNAAENSDAISPDQAWLLELLGETADRTAQAASEVAQ